MRHSSWPKKYRRVWQRTGARPGVILLEISRTAQQEGPETLADSGTIGDRIDGRIAGDELPNVSSPARCTPESMRFCWARRTSTPHLMVWFPVCLAQLLTRKVKKLGFNARALCLVESR